MRLIQRYIIESNKFHELVFKTYKTYRSRSGPWNSKRYPTIVITFGNLEILGGRRFEIIDIKNI
jgi:hypothetical protein